MNAPPCGWARFCVLSLPVSILCLLVPVFVQAEDYLSTTDYQNFWFNPAPVGVFTNYFGTAPSTAVYGGHSLGNTNSTPPSGGEYTALSSAFGQPCEGILSDVALGDFITPPLGTATNLPPANFIAVQVGDNTIAYYQSPDGGAFWVPSTTRVVAAQPNNIPID